MTGSQIREVAALAVGKAAGTASRLSGRGGGSSLPGVLARRMSPTLLHDLVVSQDVPVLAVTGSNGKTTTSRFVTQLLRGEGVRVAQNRDGANLEDGEERDRSRCKGVLARVAAIRQHRARTRESRKPH